MILRRLRERGGVAGGGDPASEPRRMQELLAQIEALSTEQRADPNPSTARRILRLRHLAGIAMLDSPIRNGSPSEAAPGDAFAGADFPSVSGREATAELLRAAILSHGALVIRGLIEPEQAARLRAESERVFEARDGEPSEADGLYEEFEPDPRFGSLFERGWVAKGGVIWLADVPSLAVETLDVYERAGLRSLLTRYLGERPLISVNKSGLRRADASAAPTWHQDGAFMGEVRTVNVWLALTACGEQAPGLAFVPQRMGEILPTGTQGAAFDWSVSPALAEQSAAERSIQRPVFEPGDAILFDDLLLHAPGSLPGMPGKRLAIESWFFGPSTFPADYVPLAF